ncbi:MAG TPA: amidohydrolase family protein [Gemmatimonadales bacterium]|nr:amidohydrolase family protein [Gemmatimonadales bacterium]
MRRLPWFGPLFALAVAITPLVAQGGAPAAAPSGPITAIRAGRLLDPESGTITRNAVILVQGGRFTAVGADVAVPSGTKVIDLSTLTVMPGLVDAHNHLALTYKENPERNDYYITYIKESSELRAIQAASNGLQMLSSGFTVVRDLGNNANYADVALRQAIEAGWLPGPTLITSGLIIGGLGGQFSPTPSMALDHKIVYPEYLEADTRDEIIKAVRQNALFGARVIKICVDCKRWGYTTEEIQLFISEAAKAGLKVAGHVQTAAGAQRAIDAGIWSIEHASALNDTLHKQMAAKGIWRVGTETPITLVGHTSAAAYQRTVAGLKNAFENKVLLTYSTDSDYYVEGKLRGEVAIEFIKSWQDAGIPNAVVLKAMTIHGYKVSELETRRGPIKPGLAADLIALSENPLESLDALRDVQFVLKDGLVYKQGGVILVGEFLHGGPQNVRRVAAPAPAAAPVPARRPGGQ